MSLSPHHQDSSPELRGGPAGGEAEGCVVNLGGKELRVVELRGVATRRLGAVLARLANPQLNCVGYFVVHLVEGGTALR